MAKTGCASGSMIVDQKIDCSEQAFLRRTIPILKTIHEHLSQGLSRALGTLIRTPCLLVTPKTLQSRLFSGYCQQLSPPTAFCSIHLSTIDDKVLVLADEAFVYHVVDRAFGGTGKRPAQMTRRDLAAIESNWMQSFFSEVCIQLESAFKSNVPLNFTLEAGQLNSLKQAYPPKTLMAVCPFELSIENQPMGQLTFLWPYEVLVEIQAIKDNYSEDRRKKETPDVFKNNLFQALGWVKVDVKAVAGSKRMRIAEIPRWKVGDVIAVDFQENSTLAVESTPLFRGKLGNADDKYALKIVDKL